MNPAAIESVDWDAAVIGAGPAGAMSAVHLAQAGAKVFLVDRELFPRYKVCGGCLNARALGALSSAGLGTLPGETIARFTLGVNRRRCTLPLPQGHAVSRNALDLALARAAQERGAVFVDGCAARIADGDLTHRFVHLQRGQIQATIRAKVVIAAGGLGRTAHLPEEFHARVARNSRLGGGVMLNGPAADYAPQSIHMALGSGGYVGIVQVENGMLNIAAAFDGDFLQSKAGLGQAAVAILNEAGFPPISGLVDAPWRGTPLLTRQSETLAVYRCLFVGDATGYVEPFTGEGMAWALESAAALTPIALRAVAGYDDSVNRDWVRAHRAAVSASQQRCRILARMLRNPRLVQFGVAALNAAPFLARPYLRRLNRAPTRLQGDPS